MFGRSSFLVDGSAAGRAGSGRSVVLPDAAVIEVLPPFAGGWSVLAGELLIVRNGRLSRVARTPPCGRRGLLSPVYSNPHSHSPTARNHSGASSRRARAPTGIRSWALRSRAAPASEILLRRLNRSRHGQTFSSDVPNAGTAPRSGRVADEAFVRALYAEHGGALLRYALHLTGGDRQRAEDLVQETIVRAWRHPEALADRPARPWLFAVARNLAVDSYRARQARPPETGQAALELLPVRRRRRPDARVVGRRGRPGLAAARPPAGDRRDLLPGCSVAEAAATLGIPAGTVKSRTFYALKALKLALQERGLAP